MFGRACFWKENAQGGDAAGRLGAAGGALGLKPWRVLDRCSLSWGLHVSMRVCAGRGLSGRPRAAAGGMGSDVAAELVLHAEDDAAVTISAPEPAPACKVALREIL